MQFAPSPILSNYIKHYLLFNLTDSDKNKFRHFANGHSGLVFSFNKEKLVSLQSKNSLPESFVFGQVSAYQDFFVDGATSVAIVLFQPIGLFALTGMDSSLFTNRTEDASLILGEGIRVLQESLFLSFGANEIINCLNSFFTKKFGELTYKHDPHILNFMSLAHSKKENLLVSNLCDQIGVSERKLQRLFSKQIGISPKKFLNNIRLHYFLSLTKKRGSLTQLGLEAGYFDQAHLIREFKKTVGFSPSKYLNSQRLAVNLIQV